MVIHRVCKSGTWGNNNINWFMICKRKDDNLFVAIISTVKLYSFSQLVEIPELLYNTINWKVLQTQTFISSNFLANSEYRNISLAKGESLLFDQDETVYFIRENNYFLGFIYVKNFDVFAGGKKSMPKLHLTAKCSAISDLVKFWSLEHFNLTYTNSLFNDVIDRRNLKSYKNEKLGICKICKLEYGVDRSDEEILNMIKNNYLRLRKY